MLRLQQNLDACRPKSDGTLRKKFYTSTREVDAATGRVIIRRVPISDDVFRHAGECVGMYSLESMMKAGITLSPVTQSYGKLSLEDRAKYSNIFDEVSAQFDAQQQANVKPEENQ